jgi:hypothetical protein
MHPAPQPAGPTSEELSDGAQRLLAEADAALSSSAFAILNNQTRSTLHRYYDAAAVRHCCQLLKDIELSSEAGQEMTVRILARAFIEAWLTALYIHFGAYEAFERVVQGTAHQVKLTEQDLKEFDARLLQAKKTAKKRLKAVTKANAGITRWNADNPSRPPKQVHDEPYIPQLTLAGVDISRRLAEDLKGVEPRPLPLTEITDRLTDLGPEKGFAQETFRPLYIYYRMFSAGSAHANINVYDAYYQPGPGFDRAAAQPTDDSLMMPVRITALYCTAFLVGWILLDAGIPAPVATELRNRYEPDPTGQASWAPGASDAGRGGLHLATGPQPAAVPATPSVNR